MRGKEKKREEVRKEEEKRLGKGKKKEEVRKGKKKGRG